MVDSWEEWAGDFSPLLLRPFGYREVWVGYDPALTGDSAGLVVVAPPRVEGGAFRVLERHQFRGNDFEEQAAAIEQITQRYSTPDTAARVFGRNEIKPLQARFAELNDWLGEEVVVFDDYEIPPAPAAA
ncbi:hypothetical protein [Burkholderia pseudomultivorans]|uniref:phage terminase large subunit family protein n=1 Tax=Burkholderia pseudomultivorans TaxID=1207504 RepID=UPI001E63B352|nr:hypothetical protein [Burkholderia pseudomultivorans]